MNLKGVCCICVLLSLLIGYASESPIGEKKKKTQTIQTFINKNVPQQLTDKDLYGSKTIPAISEEDTQAVLEGDESRVLLDSPVILVQSGSRASETIVQGEIRKYYTAATFSGIPDGKRAVTCNKDKNKGGGLGIVDAENMNWMQALRFVVVKDHQKVIIVLRDTLQTGKYDFGLKSIVWIDYKNQKLTDTMSLRYLVQFTLVDVVTDGWAARSPVSCESGVIFPQIRNKSSDSPDVAEQQISQPKQRTYAAVVKDLVNRYQQ